MKRTVLKRSVAVASFLTTLPLAGQAAKVTPQTAEQVARNFWNLHHDKDVAEQNSPMHRLGIRWDAFYLFAPAEGKGFVIVAADDRVRPVLAYSFHNNAMRGTVGPAMSWWLDASRPIIYVGYDQDNEGHCFVCDGYDEENRYHFNWGWSGEGDGFSWQVVDFAGVDGNYSAYMEKPRIDSNTVDHLLSPSIVTPGDYKVIWQACAKSASKSDSYTLSVGGVTFSDTVTSTAWESREMLFSVSEGDTVRLDFIHESNFSSGGVLIDNIVILSRCPRTRASTCRLALLVFTISA